MSMSQLMQFRTIYLRAVAQAWKDPNFQTGLVNNPVETLSNYFNFTWPWTGVCNLNIINPLTGGLWWLRDQWVWQPNSGEGLKLYLPLHPPLNIKMDDFDSRSMALADWYRQRSSLFSDDWGTQYDQNGPSSSPLQQLQTQVDSLQTQVNSLQNAVNILQLKEADSGGFPSMAMRLQKMQGDALPPATLGSASGPPPQGGYMPAAQDFTSFEIVLLQAIARAWVDLSFRDKLVLDTRTALHDIRGYELPWKLAISISDDPAATWNPPTYNGVTTDSSNQNKQSYWSHLTAHELTLLLPTSPSQAIKNVTIYVTDPTGTPPTINETTWMINDAVSEPVALAAYNAAGAEYPFTCCGQ